MTSKRVQRTAGRHGEPRGDSGDPRVRTAIAVRRRVNAGRLAATLPRRPTRGEMQDRAIERLELAVDARKRSSEQSDAARGNRDKRTAALAMAAANEQMAAREAWLKFIEHGY